MGKRIDESQVQWLASQTPGRGEYRTTDGHLVQWVNPSNHADLHPSGRFELYEGEGAEYVPVVSDQ